MSTIQKTAIVCALSLLVLAVCFKCFYSRIGKSQAIRIAELEYAKVHPDRVGHYQINVVDNFAEGEWSVWFNMTGNYALPGSCTLIKVKKDDGSFEFGISD